MTEKEERLNESETICAANMGRNICFMMNGESLRGECVSSIIGGIIFVSTFPLLFSCKDGRKQRDKNNCSNHSGGTSMAHL